MTTKTFASRSHEEMKEVLLHPDASGPEVHYHMMRGDVEDRNITVWESGTVGGEFIKTYGHYHHGDQDETYWILFGRGIAILQKRAEKNGELLSDVIEEVRIVSINHGDVLFVPPHFGHCLVNCGPSFMVTADNNVTDVREGSAGAPTPNDYEPIRDMHGFAYYIIEKDGEPALVRNTHYTRIEKEDLAGLPVVE